MMTASALLQQDLVIPLNLYWPAVSQICNLTQLPSIFNDLTLIMDILESKINANGRNIKLVELVICKSFQNRRFTYSSRANHYYFYDIIIISVHVKVNNMFKIISYLFQLTSCLFDQNELIKYIAPISNNQQVKQALLKQMLTNSDIYLCSSFQQKISPISQLIKVSSIPKNMQRTSPVTFMYCETQSQTITNNNTTYKTKIIERNIRNDQLKIIEQFQGNFTSWDFCNDYALLINREGDFLFYNMLSKNIYEAEKQHPGQFVDVDIMHTSDHLITCGGCVKNQYTNNPQRIIKVWSIDNADCLVQKSRINTGHKKAIQHSFLMNKSHVVSISSDKTLRFTNIVTQQIDSIIKTDQEFLTGCQIDHNSVIAGGACRNIRAYDKRLNRFISNINIQVPRQMIQIVNMTRFTDNSILVSNINQIFSLDMRVWKLNYLTQYEGERISSILTLNQNQFVIGNREKTFQIWKAQ